MAYKNKNDELLHEVEVENPDYDEDRRTPHEGEITKRQEKIK